MIKKNPLFQKIQIGVRSLINELIQTLATQLSTPQYLPKSYIVTLSIISLLTLGGHLFTHYALYQQSNDTYVINIAKQQLILSESLSKIALVIQSTANDYKKSLEYTNIFRYKFNLWRNFHEGLQKRDEKLGLAGQNSVQVINMFADLRPHYWAMDTTATKLINTLEEDLFHSAFYADFAILVSQLIEEESAFVRQMEAIVKQYEVESVSRINLLKQINFFWVTITLVALLLQGLFVFHPTLQIIEQLQQKFIDFKSSKEEKEAWLQGLLDNLPVPIYLKDYQGRYKFTNHQFDKFSPKLKNVKGKNDYDFFEPHLAAILQANDFKVLETKTPGQFEEIIPQADGLHTYQSIKFPLVSSTKGPYAVVGIGLDVTERNQMAKSLQESEATLQALLNAIPEIAMVVNSQGTILHVNEAAIDKLGLPPTVGCIYDVFPAQATEQKKLYISEVLRTGLPIRFEDVVAGKHTDNFVYPIATSGEMPTKVAIVGIDITRQRTATLPLPHLEQWLYLWERVITSLYEGVVIADATQPDMPVIYVNPAFEQLTGYQACDILGKNCRFLHTGDKNQAALREVRAALQNGKNCNVVLRNYRKDGTLFWNQLSLSPLYDNQGQLTHFVGIQINITTQKYAEEALRKSEERYRRIVNTTQEGIWIVDEHAVITFANQQLTDMLGYEIQELEGHYLFEFMDAASIMEIKPFFANHSQRVQQSKDVRLQHRQGQFLWTIINMSRLVDEENNFLGVLGMVVDISERKMAEAALLASENKFRFLTETVAAIILICQDNRIVYANPAATFITGYRQEELLNKHLVEFIHADFQTVTKQWCALANQEEAPRYEVKVITKANDTRWLETTIRSIEFQGQFSSLVTAFDITERKQTEEILRTIVEGVSAATGENFLKSLVKYLTKCLQVKYALIGQLLARNSTKISTLAVANDNQFVNNIEYELRNTPCEKLLTGNVPCCSCSQGIRELFPTNEFLLDKGIESCVGTPLFNEDGSVAGVIVIMDTKPLRHPKLVEFTLQIFAARASAELQRAAMVDILQQERASLAQRVLERTLELTTANAELARAARLKDEFLANMSHELRTPLNTIITLSEALKEHLYGELTPQQDDSIGVMEESGRHLLGLINDLLELAKIEAGKVKLEILPISPEVISKACLRTLKESAERKQIQTTLIIDEKVTNIQADDRYLRQILLNLLSNAIKFTPEEGKVNIEIKGQSEPGVVYLTVSDTGKGIAQEDMIHLFKPFEQLDSRLAKEHEGAGLGLCLIYRLTEMHGGSVTVESEVGVGSRFTVCLPWQLEDTLPPPLTLPHREAVILLAEDNTAILTRLSNYLAFNGYQVVIAKNGVQVVEQATELQPDLILMDLQMPVMDGLKAIRQIRNRPEIAHTPIIALTALVIPGEKERCLEAGAHEYLSKPINFKELNAAINILLSKG